ncbi:MAG: YbaK/EbsC family protein, partial [Clostridia bacterium]|nr:YbaK/EbsC family protein [Clostridia bacterium]
MSFEKASEYLKSRGYEDRIKVFAESTATVAAAAEALGCKEDEIAKSLALIAGEDVILILAKGTARLDNTKYKAEFHTKAKMIDHDKVGELVGHAAGGVCPFGVNEGV